MTYVQVAGGDEQRGMHPHFKHALRNYGLYLARAIGTFGTTKPQGPGTR